MNQQIRRSAVLVIFTFVVTLLIFVFMNLTAASVPYQEDNDDGFVSAIVMLQMATSRQEIDNAIGPLTENNEIRDRIDRMNRIDFAFMLAYCLFYITLFLWTGRLHAAGGVPAFARVRYVNIGILLAILIFISDATENFILFRITAIPSSEITDGLLLAHVIIVRFKFFFLFVASILLSFSLAARYPRRLVMLFIPSLYAVASVLGIMGLLLPMARVFVQNASLVLGLAWLLSAGLALYHVRLKDPARTLV